LEKFTNTFQKMNKPIILLEGVNLYQDERLLFDNINLSINKGDFIYLVGETGSGKSSLVKSLYAEIKISAGNIFVANYDLNKIDRNEIQKLRRDLGIVFQDFQLLSDRTVNENLKFVLKATGWTKKEEISKRINDDDLSHVVDLGEIKIDKESYLVSINKEDISLPRKEFELLYLIASKPGKVFSRDEIMTKVWGTQVIVGDRTIDVHVRKLREKIGEKYIKTIKGVGYKFKLNVKKK